MTDTVSAGRAPDRPVPGPTRTRPAGAGRQVRDDRSSPAPSGTGEERFHALMAALVRRLPFGLARVVAPSLPGFALINGFTFAVDLGLLTALRGGLGWPLPVAITLAYLAAFGLSFLLNRTFNFGSHASMGPQAAVYLAAIAVNYLVFILGVGDGLARLGLEYHLARVTAGLCEAVYMYSVMRWVVFRDTLRPGGRRRRRSGE